MKKFKWHICLFLTASLLPLTACESTKKQFDFSKKAPDEFAVVKRAPLEMPPNYELATPKPGAKRPQEPSATKVFARGAILGEEATRKVAQDNNVSEGEAVFAQRTGAANASAGIRATVDKETAEIADEQTLGIDAIRKMVGQDVEPPAKVVDPAPKQTV